MEGDQVTDGKSLKRERQNEETRDKETQSEKYGEMRRKGEK
mgnify:FL=1